MPIHIMKDEDRPEYYGAGGPFEVFKIIRFYDLNFFLGNVIKYVIRAGRKPDIDIIDDLIKARTYIDNEIEAIRRARAIGGES